MEQQLALLGVCVCVCAWDLALLGVCCRGGYDACQGSFILGSSVCVSR